MGMFDWMGGFVGQWGVSVCNTGCLSMYLVVVVVVD